MYAEENDFPTVHKIEIMKVCNRITCSKLLMTPCRKIQLLHFIDDPQPQKCSEQVIFPFHGCNSLTVIIMLSL